MRKTPDGKSHFVTIPKNQLGTQAPGAVMTPAAKKAMPGGARRGTVSPTQFIQKSSSQPYTELAEAEHAAAMLMGEYRTQRVHVRPSKSPQEATSGRGDCLTPISVTKAYSNQPAIILPCVLLYF